MNETRTEMTEEEVRAKRAALMEQLADLPPEPSIFEGVQPGETVARGTPGETKRSWDWGHLKQRQDAYNKAAAEGDEKRAKEFWVFREVTFSPAISGPIIWQGLKVDLVAGSEITTYGIFYGEYQKRMRQLGTNDRVFPPLRPEEKPTMAGQMARPHLMGFGGLDPRGGNEGGAPAAPAS